MKTKVQTILVALAMLAGIGLANATPAFLIATNSGQSAVGVSCAFGVSNFLVGIQGDSTAYYDETAQLVSTNGIAVGDRISIGRTGGMPFVAFDGTNFLMVWEDDALFDTVGDIIYGQFVSQSGALVGSPFEISAPNTNADFGGVRPIAFGVRKYLVIWQDGPAHDTSYGDIHGVFISPNGPMSGIVNFTSGAITATAPALAFGRTNGLVVWCNRQSGPGEQWDIDGEFISTNGIPGSPFVVSQTPSPSFNPCAAAFDGTNFFVVWNKDIGPGYPSPAQWNIYGRLVSPGGTFPDNETALITDTNNPVLPYLAFDGASYLMSWRENLFGGVTDSQIDFQFYNRSITAIGPTFTLFAPAGTNAPLFGTSLFDGTRFLTVATIGATSSGGNGNYSAGTGVYGRQLPASTASPILTAGNRIGSQFPVTLTGTPGINYAILVSTNPALADWTTIATNTPANGTFSFTDTSATNSSRFYRAVKQ